MTGLRSALHEIAAEALTYDVVERAHARGRTRRRLRQAVAAGAVVVAVIAVGAVVNVVVGQLRSAAPAGPPLPSSCTVQQLPVPEGYSSRHAQVHGGDPSGRFLIGVGSVSAAGPSSILIWDNGRVGTAQGPGPDARLEDINSRGDGVGNASDPFTTWAYAYHDGEMIRLPGGNPDSPRPSQRGATSATRINERGEMIGSVATPDGMEYPVLWRSPTAEPEFLPLPPDRPYGQVLDIDDDGTMIGNARKEGGDNMPVLWTAEGELAELRVPAAVRGDGFPIVGGSLRDGWVLVSKSPLYPAPATVYAWNIRTGHVHRVSERARVVNALGWVTGPDLTLVSAQGTLALPHPAVPEGADAVLVWPEYLSDDGRTIGGYLSYETSDPRDWLSVPLIWHCN